MDIMEDLYTTTFSNNEAFFKNAAAEIESLRARVAELKAENDRLKGLNVELTDRCNWYNCDGTRLERQRDEYKAENEQLKKEINKLCGEW